MSIASAFRLRARDRVDRPARVSWHSGPTIDLGERSIRFGQEPVHGQFGDKRPAAIQAHHLGIDREVAAEGRRTSRLGLGP